MDSVKDDDFYRYSRRPVQLDDVRDFAVEQSIYQPPPDPGFAERGGAGEGGTTEAVPEPFDVTAVTDNEDGTSTLTIQPGTVNNLIPSNMFAALKVPNSGTRYLVLGVTTTASGVVSAAALSIESSAPAAIGVDEAAPPTSLDILLAVIVDAVAFQVRNGNITATSTQAFIVDKDPPGKPGTLSYVPWYTWGLS
jgi:hypothetical protein